MKKPDLLVGYLKLNDSDCALNLMMTISLYLYILRLRKTMIFKVFLKVLPDLTTKSFEK